MELREKKQRRLTAKDSPEYGDIWDHVAIDPKSKLIVSLGVGKRTEAQTHALVMDAKGRLAEGSLPAIFTDAYASYEQAILHAFGRRYLVARRGMRGRRPAPVLRRPRGLVYAQVKKHYQGRRVREVEIRPIFGKTKLNSTLETLGFNKVNTSAIERANNTSRQRNRRKARKTLAFSKAPRYHRWMSWLSTGMYNFCRSHGGLRQRQDGHVLHRTPAMAAGLMHHIWSVRQWLLYPVLEGQR